MKIIIGGKLFGFTFTTAAYSNLNTKTTLCSPLQSPSCKHFQLKGIAKYH